MRGERGFALVITLIVTALLVALLAEFVNEVYVDTSHSHNFVASQQASILAESGIDGGVKLLQVAATLRMGQSYSALTEVWAKPQSYDSGNGTVTIRIEEESGKLNLNTATNPKGTQNEYSLMVARLLKNLQLSPDLLDVLMDWVDDDDAPKPGGAETSYYMTLKTPYRAKNARLETFEELALLKGYTPKILTTLRPLVTVYGGSDNAEFATKINVNTAPKEVLAALDDKMSDDLVNRILDHRTTTPIKNQKEFLEIAGTEALTPAALSNIAYGGKVYRIFAEGRVGESVSVAEAVVRMQSMSNASVIYWREY